MLLDHETGVEAEAEMPADIRIYNYAGRNHCPIQYQGLKDFWCDPHQLRYPPEPWCDVLPTYNVKQPLPLGATDNLHRLRKKVLEDIGGLQKSGGNEQE